MSGSLLFTFFLLLVSYSNGQNPQTCISTSIEAFVTKDDPTFHLFDYSATLAIKNINMNTLTRFLVTDEVFTSSNSSMYRLNGDGLLAQIGPNKPTRCSSVGGYCSWFVENDTVFTSLPLVLDNYRGNVRLTENLFDEGGINYMTGFFFSDSLPCITDTIQTSSFPGYTFTSTQCCKKYMSVSAPPANSLKCRSFNATATFTSNDNVLAIVNANITIDQNGMTIMATSEGPQLGNYMISLNRESEDFCSGSLGNPSTCKPLLAGDDFKVIFPVSIWQPSGQTWSYDMNLGRIIRRNGIYEKEEGMAFMTMSPCSSQYTTFPGNPAWGMSQICCTSFA